MRTSALAGTLALIGLAACSAGSGSFSAMETGVGFGDYQRYLQQREATRLGSAPYSVPPETGRTEPALIAPPTMPESAPTTLSSVPVRYRPAPATPAPSSPTPTPQVTTQALPAPVTPASRPQAAAGQPLAAPMRAQPIPTAQPRAQVQPLRRASLGTPRAVDANPGFGTTPSFDAGPSVRPGVSDEQDFAAVSARETIESDRERLAEHRAQYQLIEVTSVPGPEVSGGPNIVAYALSQPQAVGTEVYNRMNPLRWRRWEAACLEYRTQDAAQEAFLRNGGPQRDPDNLDPDGDGFACWWDPTALRQAMAASR
ncbi:MAG: hypothetical protein Kow0013_26100 [Pararhodobacter sp.]